MKGHPSIPKFDNLNRMCCVVGWLVQYYLPEPAANDGPQHDVEDEVNEACRIRTRGAGPKTVGSKQGIGIAPSAEKSENIREGIPADGKRTDTDCNRIDRRKYYDKCCHHDQKRLQWLGATGHPRAAGEATAGSPRCVPDLAPWVRGIATMGSLSPGRSVRRQTTSTRCPGLRVRIGRNEFVRFAFHVSLSR
jgi:hypothetical protein